jgi:hypothetical protein
VVEVIRTVTTHAALEAHFENEAALGFPVPEDTKRKQRELMTLTVGDKRTSGGHGCVPTYGHVRAAAPRHSVNERPHTAPPISKLPTLPTETAPRVVETFVTLRSEADLWVFFEDRETNGFPVPDGEQENAFKLMKLQGWVRGVAKRAVS